MLQQLVLTPAFEMQKANAANKTLKSSFGSMIQLCLISTEQKPLHVLFQFSSCFQLFHDFQDIYLPFVRSLWRAVVVEHGYERRKGTMKDSQFPSLSVSAVVPSSPTTTLHRCSRAAAKASSRLSLSCLFDLLPAI